MEVNVVGLWIGHGPIIDLPWTFSNSGQFGDPLALMLIGLDLAAQPRSVARYADLAATIGDAVARHPITIVIGIRVRL